MFYTKIYSIYTIYILVFSASSNCQNISDGLEISAIAKNGNHASGREGPCVNCASDFNANPSTAFLPVIPALIALKTVLVLSVIAWIIVKVVFAKKDDQESDNTGYGYGYAAPQSSYGAPPSSQYSPHRMDFSQYGNYYNAARSLANSPSFGKLTNVVWNALEKYSRSD